MITNYKRSLWIFALAFIITVAGFWIVPYSFYITFYMILPASILAAAFRMGMGGCSIVRGFVSALIVGVSCMLVEYLTLSLSNMIMNRYSNWNLYSIPNMPQFELILIGGVIFILGLLAGFVFRLFKRS